jgi:hypothetical protein
MRKVTMLAVLAAVAAAGCGGGGGGGGGTGYINSFVGTWDYSGGTISQSCPGAQPEMMNLLTYSVAISRTGNAGELQWTSNFDSCTRYLQVRGTTASMTGYAAPCGDEGFDFNNDHYVLTITPQTEVVTLGSGMMLIESATNKLDYYYDDNTVLSCTSNVSNATLY